MKSLLSTITSSNIRNIGIIAHIDAGKTTLTERLLYHAGLIKRIGSVDRGDTVMDYLPQERARGITIKAACISLAWNACKSDNPKDNVLINIIDTPGHVDFTIEVERAMRVMDGAVAVVDGSAGVQAQTVTVWQQADKFKVNRLVFVNKLDKIGADFNMAVKDIENRFKVVAVPLSEPVYSNSQLIGIHDFITNQVVLYNGEHGEHVESHPFPNNTKQSLLMEKIAELDEDFLTAYLENQGQSMDNMKTALNRIIKQSKAVPIISGSAFKNIGVQSVLNSVADYLPQPTILNDSSLLALAFKVIMDEQRGLLVFVRVYSGTINNKTTLYNLNAGKKERVVEVMQAAGKMLDKVESVHSGQIAVLIGLKSTATGDTLSNDPSKHVLDGVSVPQPVFQMACSFYSQSEEERVTTALTTMSLEDPSLKMEKDPSTGQIVVSGMGELHLEIAGQRLKEDFKCPQVQLSKVRITYRETISEMIKGELEFEKNVNGTRLSALVSLIIEPLPLIDGQYCSTDVVINFLPEAVRVPKHINSSDYVTAVKDGLDLALTNGPLRGSRVVGIKVLVKKVHWMDSDSTPTAVRHSTMQLVSSLYSSFASKFNLIEPIMNLNIKTDAKHLGTILSDLHSERRAVVFGYGSYSDTHPNQQEIHAEAPLLELMGYITWLRTATSGDSSLSMTLKGYKPM